MKFSIIIPAHNSAGYIRKALDSIKAQTFTDYELIVVCDSCTDNTEEIAKEYGALTAAVEYHADGLTRNHGIEMARGDWVLFLDDDDWWLHEFVLQQLSDKLNNAIDILCFSFIFRGVKYANPLGNGGMWHWPACWCKCYKRTAIGSSRFSDVTDGTADVQFFQQMFTKGLTIVDWDMPMYYYNYFREGSQSANGEDWRIYK